MSEEAASGRDAIEANDVVAEVGDRIGLADPLLATRIVAATISSIAETLPASLAENVAARSPSTIARALRQVRSHSARLDASAIASRVARRCGLSIGQAREATMVVYGVLASHLDTDTLERTRRELPDSIAELLVVPSRSSPAPRHAPREVMPAARLSTARPSSGHPLSSAPPRAPAVEAHEHRLSTSHGTRQEQAEETLARSRR